MRLLAVGLLLFSLPGLVAAPVPKELKQKPDAERIQGVWIYDSYDTGGPGRGNAGRWFFEKDKMYSGGSNTTDNKGSAYGFVIRPETAPTEMDIHAANGPVICVGIYKFEGDELTIAYVGPGGERPKDYKSANGKTVITFKRATEVKK